MKPGMEACEDERDESGSWVAVGGAHTAAGQDRSRGHGVIIVGLGSLGPGLTQAASWIEPPGSTGVLNNLNIYSLHIYKGGKETKGDPKNTPIPG